MFFISILRTFWHLLRLHHCPYRDFGLGVLRRFETETTNTETTRHSRIYDGYHERVTEPRDLLSPFTRIHIVDTSIPSTPTSTTSTNKCPAGVGASRDTSVRLGVLLGPHLPTWPRTLVGLWETRTKKWGTTSALDSRVVSAGGLTDQYTLTRNPGESTPNLDALCGTSKNLEKVGETWREEDRKEVLPSSDVNHSQWLPHLSVHQSETYRLRRLTPDSVITNELEQTG